MVSANAENDAAFLQDCLLEGRPAESVTFCLADDLLLSPAKDGVLAASSDGAVSCRLNATAALILSYCTGDHTLGDIAEQADAFLQPACARVDPKILLLTTLWHLRALNLIHIVSPQPPHPSPTRLEAPLRDVHLFLTHQCPLQCVHCCVAPEQRRELTTFQILGILTQLQRLGLPKLSLTGGEPLLREDFFEIAEAARLLGLAFDMATSGVTLDQAAAIRIAEFAPLNVSISVYSAIPEIHDRITGVPGSWKRSLAAIRRLTDVGAPVTLKCMVMSLNYDSYAGVADLARELGQQCAFDPGITCRLDGCRVPLTYRITAQQLQDFARTPFWRHMHEQRLDAADRPCNAGAGRVAICATGDVHPCALFPLKLGSITEQPLRNILSGKSAQQVRQLRIRDMGDCAACHYLRHCAPCPGLAFLEHGNYHCSPGWCCALARAQRDAPVKEARRKEREHDS